MTRQIVYISAWIIRKSFYTFLIYKYKYFTFRNNKQQTLQIKNSIESQKTELKKLYDEEIIFDQNKRNELHVSIISSQKTLIEDYKEKNYQLTLNLKNSEKRVLEIDRSFKSNNAELKNNSTVVAARTHSVANESWHNRAQQVEKYLTLCHPRWNNKTIH